MKSICLGIIVMIATFNLAFSQKNVISGKITDKDGGSPLVGVTIKVKGSTTGTYSRTGGEYSISVADEAKSLVFSYVGYQVQEIQIDGRNDINVELATDALKMGDVVVTAFGLERDKKALGYAVQEVSGSQIAQSRETNIVNSLSGRVAGVQVSNGSAGAGATSRIVIRGEKSFTGRNQPLFIVDGVPITNETDMRNLSSNMRVDYGNGAQEINSNDVESMTVLKGPNATALYGSRAANGAIIIKTKSGRGQEGLGVSFNSSSTFESMLVHPKFQNRYGQGKNFQFEFRNGYGSGINDGVDESWGPAFDGQMIRQHSSPASGTHTYADGRTVQLRGGDVHGLTGLLGTAGLDLDRRGEITPTAWTYGGNPFEGFYEVGRTLMNTIAFTGGNDRGNFRLSVSNMDNTGISPNTDLRRNTISLNTGYNLSSDVTISAVANYVNSKSNNREVNAYGTESVPYLFTWWGGNVNVGELREYWQRGREGSQQYNYNYNYHDNPYFNMFENTNGLDKHRIFGNIRATVALTDELSFFVRSGIDHSDEFRPIQRAYSTQRFPFGQYREDKVFSTEMNTDFLFTYNTSNPDGISYNVSAGGNIMKFDYNYSGVSNNKLLIPNIYTFTNSDIPLVTDFTRLEKQINSLYGFANLDWKNLIYLDLAARNDWSSTLPTENNSYFYPSAQLSFIVSDILEIPETSDLTFAKLRLGFAQVGNDTDPYRLQNVFNFGVPFGPNQLADESAEISNADLKPEITSSFEIGFDTRFFDNRIGLDFTYYNNTTSNQIISISVPRSTGFGSRVINAGEVQSYGIEIMLNATPVKLENGFQWNTFVNWSWDRTYINSLADGVSTYQIGSGANGLALITMPGQRMGELWGTSLQEYDPISNELVKYVRGKPYRISDFQKNQADLDNAIARGDMKPLTNTDDFKTVWNNGAPIPDPDLRPLGNYNPDWILGWGNNFTWKGFNLGFLFEYRHGGVVYSETRLIAATAGNIEESLWGRDAENGGAHPGIKDSYVPYFDNNGNKLGDHGVIGEGVRLDPTSGQYIENDVALEVSAYHNRRYARGRHTQGMYDASFLKLRELRLGYDFPKEWLQDYFIQGLNLAFIGRNLALWTENPHFDPEQISFGGGNRIIPGIENHPVPSTRSWGIDLNVRF